ncbi:F-box protein At3g12350-like [Primulina eburnea]|uniref:F-box protein At3g12350-like n=1 Tax=Primulina eburnea TaxID=1245227 RepID=UPI003C6CBB43
MELILPFSFNDFPEDVQIRILSFLNPWELELFARTSTRFLALCRDDERLWFLKCRRRWGSQTQIQNWGGRKISYRHLYHLLEKYENLIGFWHLDDYMTISQSLSPSLVCFEWGSFYITGYMISPSKCGGYGVTKKPFLWITATSNGKGLNYLDTSGSVSLTEKDMSRLDSEKLRSELILVDTELSVGSYFYLSVWENPQFFEFRKRLSTRNGREEYESVYKSPPDGLMTQIYETLGSKLSVTGGKKSKRERTGERQREREKWRRVLLWDSKQFQKLTEYSPAPSRPLQGLWKGICPDRSLNLYLVSYREEWGLFYCKKVDGSCTLDTYRDTVFTASCSASIQYPFSTEEESTYNTRVHVRPRVEANQAGQNHATISSDHHNVLRIFYAHSGYNPYPSSSSGNSDDIDGRIWLYADGTFGFGFLRDDCIVDMRPVIENGRLLDTMV